MKVTIKVEGVFDNGLDFMLNIPKFTGKLIIE